MYNIQDSDTNPIVGTEQQKFLDSMYDTPYVEVRLGIWKQRGEIMVEKGVDVMLATDLITHAYKDHYDTAIVVSGDADFYPALQAVKDVGKHIEVAAFDMNLSAESGRVADVTIKFNKTYFTGLWMTRAQARSRAAASAKPEVSDEAASPNGENKAATKASTGRRSNGRRATTATAKPRRASTSRARKPSTRRAGSSTDNSVAENGSKMRRTPTRRRVGGTSLQSADRAGNGRSVPRPPALRKNVETKPEAAEAKTVETSTPRRSCRGRLGLTETKEE